MSSINMDNSVQITTKLGSSRKAARNDPKAPMTLEDFRRHLEDVLRPDADSTRGVFTGDAATADAQDNVTPHAAAEADSESGIRVEEGNHDRRGARVNTELSQAEDNNDRDTE